MQSFLPLSVELEGVQDGGPPLTEIPQVQRVVCAGGDQGPLWGRNISSGY